MKDCNQCGRCCQIYGDGGLSASQEDIAWWDDHRPEIARYQHAGQILMDPVSGARLPACPWLEKLPEEEKYTCAIYFDRPDDCRQYPVLFSDMIKDGCEMIEAVDLQNPGRAQRRLDDLMSESRGH